MDTYYIAFRRFHLGRTIRLEVIVRAESKQEARTIAEQELRNAKRFRFFGSN